MKAPSNPININLGDGFVLTGDLSEMLRIDPDNLVEQLAEQAPMCAYVGSMMVRAKAMQRNAEARRDELYARLYGEAKEKAPPKATETSVKMEVEQNSEYQAANTECNLLAAQSANVENVLSGYRERKFLMTELSALVRATSNV